MTQKKWTVTISSNHNTVYYENVEGDTKSQAVTRALALWFNDHPDEPVNEVKVCEAKETPNVIQDTIDKKLDEILGEIKALWRAFDRINDSITELVEGTEDLGEITEEDI